MKYYNKPMEEELKHEERDYVWENERYLLVKSKVRDSKINEILKSN